MVSPADCTNVLWHGNEIVLLKVLHVKSCYVLTQPVCWKQKFRAVRLAHLFNLQAGDKYKYVAIAF